MKHIILCLAIFLCLSGTQSYASKKLEEPQKRFALFTNCEPIYIVVERMSKDALKIGLTEESIQNAVVSRIRSARLYSNQMLNSYLYVDVHVVGPAYHISVRLRKILFDQLSSEKWPATTWKSRSTGTHGDNPGFILSSISRHIERFLVEFLRVNDEACQKKK